MPARELSLQDSIADRMYRDPCQLHVDFTVGEALEYLRQNPPQERIIYFYVVDNDGLLKGVIPTRRLLLSELSIPLTRIMLSDVISINHKATVLDACEFFIFHRLLGFPVVDDEGHLLGAIDVELYTEELGELERSERNDDLFQLIGVHLAEAQQASRVAAFQSRFPWLMANITGGLLAAGLSYFFEAELDRVVALALFMPVVLALGESVAVQSVTLTLQMLHGQKPTWLSTWHKIRREVSVGALLGAASAGIIALVALAWLGHGNLSVTLFGGITASVICASMIGVTIPNVLRIMRRDPHVAAGPISLTLADMMTLLAYLGLARVML